MFKAEAAPPNLIEGTTKLVISQTLQKCHTVRMKYYGILLNVSLAILFFAIFGGFLYYRHKNKLSDVDYAKKMEREKEYMLSKIRFYQEQNHKMIQQVKEYSSPLEGLPTTAALQL